MMPEAKQRGGSMQKGKKFLGKDLIFTQQKELIKTDMSIQKRPRDTNQLAKRIVDLSTGEEPETDPYKGKNPAAVELGRLGGKKGGKARASALTPQRRSEIAKQAAKKRWGKDQDLQN